MHGGWVALTFDELLGMTNIASGHPGMTGTLKIRYLRPTPLFTDVRLEAWTERVEGRRIVAARLWAGDTLTAEAEGSSSSRDRRSPRVLRAGTGGLAQRTWPPGAPRPRRTRSTRSNITSRTGRTAFICPTI